jgi:hypothetical protein
MAFNRRLLLDRDLAAIAPIAGISVLLGCDIGENDG